MRHPLSTSCMYAQSHAYPKGGVVPNAQMRLLLAIGAKSSLYKSDWMMFSVCIRFLFMLFCLFAENM